MPFRQRDEYLRRVNQLYDEIVNWLHADMRQCRVQRNETVSLQEDEVGTYEAPILIIECPDSTTIRLVPKGRWVLGTDIEGRIDLVSDLGVETLVYLPEQEDGVWVYVQDKHLRQFPTLNRELFFQIMEAIRR